MDENIISSGSGVSSSAPAPSSSTEPVPQREQTTSSPEPSSSPSNASSSTPDSVSSGGYKLTVDENGKRTLTRVEQQPATEQPTQPDTNPSQETLTNSYTPPQDKPQYTIDELVSAMQTGNVDSSRVPEKFEQQYANYRISKAIEEENVRRRNEEALRNIQMQQMQEASQGGPNALEQRLERMRDIDAQADELAKKDAGFTQDDLDAFEYMDEEDEKYKAYKMHKEWHKQRIISELNQRANDYALYQQRQREVYQDISIYTEQLKQTEPNFNEIDVIALNRYKTLPFEQGAKIAEVITAYRNGNISPSQAEILRRYYEDTRKEYYAGKNGINIQAQRQAPKPPAVESTGQGSAYNKGPEALNIADLRNGSVRDRRAWLSAFLSRNNRK